MELTGKALVLHDGPATGFADAFEAIAVPVLQQRGSVDIALMSAEDFFEQDRRAILDMLLDTTLVFADADSDHLDLFYALGLRDALAGGATILLSTHGGREAGQALPAVIDLSARDAAETLDAAIVSFCRTGRSLAPIRQGPLRTQYSRQAAPAQAAPLCWDIGASAEGRNATAARIGIKPGELLSVTGVDAWVNSENIFMEMPGVYEPTISGTIRFLGANWTTDYQDSDDALRRELAEEMGARRSVAVGTTLLTKVQASTALCKDHGVRMVAHVATVVPAQRSRAGCGFIASEGMRKCVFSALEAIAAANGRFLSPTCESVLMPLFGTGRGQADVGVVSQVLINAALDYLRAHPGGSIRQVWFLARTDYDFEACRRAIELDPDIVAIPGGR